MKQPPHAYRGSARDRHITRQRLLEVSSDHAVTVHLHRCFRVLIGMHPEAERHVHVLLLEGNVDRRSDLNVSEGLRKDGSRENGRKTVQTGGEDEVLVAVGDHRVDASNSGLLISGNAQSRHDVTKLREMIPTSVRSE